MTRRIVDDDHDLDIGRLPSLRHRMMENPMAQAMAGTFSLYILR
jgi:hypothetical protein